MLLMVKTRNLYLSDKFLKLTSEVPILLVKRSTVEVRDCWRRTSTYPWLQVQLYNRSCDQTGYYISMAGLYRRIYRWKGEESSQLTTPHYTGKRIKSVSWPLEVTWLGRGEVHGIRVRHRSWLPQHCKLISIYKYLWWGVPTYTAGVPVWKTCTCMYVCMYVIWIFPRAISHPRGYV